MAGLEAGGDGQTSGDGFAGARGGADCGGRERAEGGAGAERRAVACGEVDARAAGDGQRRAGQDWRPCAAEGRGRPSGVARRADGGGGVPLARTGGRTCRARAPGRLPTVWTFIRREGLSFKKNRAGERAKPSRRRPQAEAVDRQGRFDPRRPVFLVFLDETWAKTNMGPLRGWAPRGLRLPGQVPTDPGRP